MSRHARRRDTSPAVVHSPLRKLALATVFAVLAVACAGDTTDEPVDLPEITAAETTAAAAETTVVETDTPAKSCPEGEHFHDGAGCHPETPQPEHADGTDMAVGDMTTPELCEASGGAWDADASTCHPAQTADIGDVLEEPVMFPVRQIYEGITSEELCLVAGGDWDGEQCIATVFENPEEAPQRLPFWHPALMEVAYQAIDPETVKSDDWDDNTIGGPWGYYNYHLFYHYDDVEEPQVQYEVMRQAAAYAVINVFQYATDWVWFPHRYDISWTDDPDYVSITGTYPLGEQRTLRLHVDPEQRAAPDIEPPLPLPPPIRPTTPFAEPEMWDFAADLGRDCPPVEDIWDGYGSEVTDQCTLQAIENAVNYMWVGDAVWRQVAIRDGHAMADWLQQIDDIEDPS